MSTSRKSQQNRLAHLNHLSQRIGVDGIAICGNEADLSFYDEFNFDGLMNEPWYDRLDGKEMRIFKKPF